MRERRHLQGEETLAELAADAASAALADAGVAPSEVDHVIAATITPDQLTPGLAPALAARVGAEHAGVVDLNAACTGFLYWLEHAAALIETARARNVLVVRRRGALAHHRPRGPRNRRPFRRRRRRRRGRSGRGQHRHRGLRVRLRRRSSRRCSTPSATSASCAWPGRQTYRHAVAQMTEASTKVLERQRRHASRRRLLRRPPGQRAHHHGGR